MSRHLFCNKVLNFLIWVKQSFKKRSTWSGCSPEHGPAEGGVWTPARSRRPASPCCVSKGELDSRCPPRGPSPRRRLAAACGSDQPLGAFDRWGGACLTGPSHETGVSGSRHYPRHRWRWYCHFLEWVFSPGGSCRENTHTHTYTQETYFRGYLLFS